MVPDGGLQFVLRVAAKLRDKPKPPPDADGAVRAAAALAAARQLCLAVLAGPAVCRRFIACRCCGAAAAGGAKREWRNPFLPYERALWVADLGGG